ncbi:inositol polyphosphate multikinase isoform X1 [Fundulus heteroclitus]|uniref:inositol polyphosphate multikinase isoform X1 n=2 Tax=Fundulus heteroclitus TaxID=8078 RepID=UPI00165BF7EF|nr:inositol polyphosphate multikinase isoform X1 [Fundulus heteroclitus]
MSGAEIMESTKGLGKLELTPGLAAIGDSASTNKSGQQLLGPQDQAHMNGCVPLSHQVAGHKYGVDKVGILQHPDGTVLKQVQPPPRGPREMQFYSMVFAEDCSDPCLLDLQNHLPKYYGTWSSPDSPNELYLKLEDVTSHFNRPCIMDVKLGQRSYDPFASQEKREQQIRKYPLMEEIGFLILGMRVYNVHSNTFDSYNQHYGRGLTQDTVKDGLAKFFHNGVCLRRDAIRASICRLQQILHWFHSQHQLAFYASSLLFVYEGLPSSFTSSSFSYFLSDPSVSVAMMKTANLLLVGDGVQSQEGKVMQEEAGQENKVEEYNNNNTEVAVSWDSSISTVRTNHRKEGDHLCVRGFLHINRLDDVAAEITKAADSGDHAPALYEEDNTCLRKDDQKLSCNGNRNNKDGERGKMSRTEEEDEGLAGQKGTDGQGSTGDAGVEVRMIDFAHVFQSDSHDHGYIFGLKHLLTVLEQILCDAAQS